jgi:diaminohydroxyphosphoribosylaminopyrimidine deaminase/5-amino-6-(5-phosphoribosylamino)uracil reductase
LGTAAPNPAVGCVIVYKNKIIGEGHTSAYGGAHAEVNAVASVKDKTLLEKSTLYVSLEPCCHHGKTPPCTTLIIEHKIPRVVIGCVDTNKKVSGKGIAALESAGCTVIVGVEEELCSTHHRRFFTFQNKKRPYIILKWAETKNGYIAPLTKGTKRPVWISTPESRQLVHQWRTEEHAILVGGNTVLEDNPRLTTRMVSGRNPIRVVVDHKGNLPKSAAVFDDKAQTIVLTPEHIDFKKNSAQQLCAKLHDMSILSVLVEGGQKTLQHFIDENLWDEIRVFKGNIVFDEGLKAPVFEAKPKFKKNSAEDELLIYTNEKINH